MGRQRSDLVAARGALVGWKRLSADQSCLLTLQVANSAKAYREREFDLVELALNQRQLRSLARDLCRAAGEQGVPVWGKPNFWERVSFLLSAKTPE
jgi:hypothetical protein